MTIDLHMHSCASDGALPPEAVVDLCALLGVELMSLTDHDTTSGLAAAARRAREKNIRFIPGVEASSTYGGQSIHIVGLGIDADGEATKRFFADVAAKREARGRRIGEIFAERFGIEGAYEGAVERAGGTKNLSRTHFAAWLHDKGFVPTYQAAFDKYLRNGAPCAVGNVWPSVSEVVDFILGTGGLPVLAHPGRYRFQNSWELYELIKCFQRAGGVGIEVTSGSQPTAADAAMADVARDLKLMAGTGSDWHSLRSARPLPGTQPMFPKDLQPIWQALGVDLPVPDPVPPMTPETLSASVRRWFEAAGFLS